MSLRTARSQCAESGGVFRLDGAVCHSLQPSGNGARPEIRTPIDAMFKTAASAVLLAALNFGTRTWYPRRDLNPHAEALVPKTSVSAVPPLGHKLWWALMDSNHRVSHENPLYRRMPSATRPNAHIWCAQWELNPQAGRFELPRFANFRHTRKKQKPPRITWAAWDLEM
jgi:hypothetical protein